MGGAAGFLLELMLLLGFKYKLNMTTRLGHFILLTQHNATSLVLEATLGCIGLKTVNREDPSQQPVLFGTKATTIIAYKTQKVSYNSSVTSYIISSMHFRVKGGVPWNPGNPPPPHPRSATGGGGEWCGWGEAGWWWGGEVWWYIRKDNTVLQDLYSIGAVCSFLI